jgi:hypothetical protein
MTYACPLSCFSFSPEAESTYILNVDEKNKLGAKIIKAEMMGNMVRPHVFSLGEECNV